MEENTYHIYTIIHAKDDMYDLYNELGDWIMSRNCPDNIFNQLMRLSKLCPIRINFVDKTMEEKR